MARTWRVPRRLKIAGALSAVLGATLLILGKAGVPDGAWWDKPTDPPVIVTVLLLVVGLVYNLYDAWTKQREPDDIRVGALRDACRRSIVPISDALPDVSLRKLGVHIWLVRRKKDRLERLVKYTMELERQPTPMVWSRGKGMIGLAWDHDERVARDLSVPVELAENPDAFAQLAPDERLGMTDAEWRRARRYRVVLAVPLHAPAADDVPPLVIGVFSVDCAESGQEIADALLRLHDEDEEFRSVLATCETLLQAHCGYKE
jgi:hypothetical protein